MEECRLQKYMALCGVASRRRSEEMIVAGKVKINGQTVTELGTKVTSKDVVTVDGKRISPEEKKYYIMLNKPKYVICSVKDEKDRKCAVDLIEGIDARLYPVGRLDYDTSGLLLLTNDGEFMQKMTHPSFEVWKTYEALVKGVPDKVAEERFRTGMLMEGDPRQTAPALLTVLEKRDNDRSLVEVMLREGRTRQVRRMLETVGHPVVELKRVRIGCLELGNLKTGAWRKLSEDEVERLLGRGSEEPETVWEEEL